MKLKRSPIAAIAVVASGLTLNACQTAPSTSSAPSAAAKPTQTKPAESAKSITPEMARNLANNCFTCHGPNGRSPGSIPSLVTLSRGDIVTKLKRFKSGEAPSTVMGRQAKGYTDVEIEAVANYIASLKK